ncbi:MAG: type II toxin-antitoxin system RelE/ParE family toxin [Myxococcales bacterium]|nr:type II toxin-antitoxin system RelE/ParE family toxin [Myxococcales bacterium]
MKLVALPEAMAEFEEAVAYYEEQRPGLGLEFFMAIEAAVDFAAETPAAGSPLPGPDHRFRVRRYVVKRFPYLVFIAGEGAHPKIVAISHAARRPGYWRDRLK